MNDAPSDQPREVMPKTESIPEVMDRREAAKRATVTLPVIDREIKEGRLKARKCGRRVLIRGADFLAWLEGLPLA